MLRPLLSLAALTALAMPAWSEEIACQGAFGIDSSEARLIESYGADNVWTGTVDGPEGTQMLATEVFRDSPKRRLQFVWWDEENRKDPSYIELASKMVAPGGVRAGMSVAEVEALNGEPFNLSGFGWDYGGGAGFESGALSNLAGGCKLSLTFSPTAYPEGVDVDSLMGDVQLVSSNPLIETLDARLDWVAIGYPHPDFRD